MLAKITLYSAVLGGLAWVLLSGCRSGESAGRSTHNNKLWEQNKTIKPTYTPNQMMNKQPSRLTAPTPAASN
jgi:hypothetical protein